MAGLGGLSKQAKNDQRSKASSSDLAALDTGADFKAKAKSKAVFRRFTFSLNGDVSQDIDDLILAVRTKRLSRSDIVKIAIDSLKGLSSSELDNLIK